MCWNCVKMMKSYIWVQTADGSIQQIEQAVAMFCPFISHEVHVGKGFSKTHAICLPEKVTAAMLSLILDFCRFHQEPGHSNKEKKSFDEKFMRMDTRRLCELASASDSLQFKPLVELTSRALARTIEGKTPEEIREIFCLPDDLTEEEKLEPVRNLPGDPRIRLLNRLYAKRRKELQQRSKVKITEDGEAPEDNRSVDDLLLFINGESKDSDAAKASNSKNKKKKQQQRRKEKQEDTSSSTQDENHKDLDNGNSGDCNHHQPCSSKITESKHKDGTSTTQGGESDDDEIDPVIKEKIDREVEDFSRRLNLNWQERLQELLHGPEGETNTSSRY